MTVQKITSMLRRELPYITVLLAIACAVRIAYASLQPEMRQSPDGHEYYNSAVSLHKNGNLKQTFSPYRPPLYPVFTALTMRIVKQPPGMNDYAYFPILMQSVASAQMILGIMGTILLYILLRFIRIPGPVSAGVAVLFTVDFLITPFERAYLTESLAVFWTVCFMCFCGLWLKSNTIPALFLLLFWSIVGITLKPALVTLFPGTLACAALFFRPGKVKLFVYLSFLILYLLPVRIWINHNYSVTGIPLFSVYAPINILGRILKDDIPIGQEKNFTFYYNAVTDNRKRNGPKNPYRFLGLYEPSYFKNPETLKRLDAFTKTVVLTQAPRYISAGIQDIPRAFGEISDTIRIENTGGISGILTGLQNIFRTIHMLFLYMIPLHTALLLFIVRKKTFAVRFGGILLLIGYVHSIGIGVYTAYEDYGRLAVPFITLIVIGSGIVLSESVRIIRSTHTHKT